ncbi:MAG: hypothetical protein CMH12_18330 [Maritimibacter sp.]|nr:hypothetical protein [Maritimibacter sp.]
MAGLYHKVAGCLVCVARRPLRATLVVLRKARCIAVHDARGEGQKAMRELMLDRQPCVAGVREHDL